MFINPKTAIEKGWITGIKNPDNQIQPNAIDFTADRAFTVAKHRNFFIDEERKEMRGGEEVEILHDGQLFTIEGRDMLDFLSDVYVDLPEGIAAQLVIRSTLARNGLILTSGLYDSGFKGHIGFLLHNNHNDPAIIRKGTRVGQIIFISSDSAGTYAGGYNHELGTELGYQQ
jgi:dUTP pyrophosphatase